MFPEFWGQEKLATCASWKWQQMRQTFVLTALGLLSEEIEGYLRIGLGKFTTESDIITAAEILTNAVVEIGNRVY